MTWQHYLKETRDELKPRYVELCEDIAMRAEELGMMTADEKRTRAHTWKASEFTTVSGRDSEASASTADLSADILKLRSELEAVREERDLLRWLLDAPPDA